MVTCDQTICMFCGGCVAVCTKEAIAVYDLRVTIDQDLCVDCGNCMTVCPVGAMRRP